MTLQFFFFNLKNYSLNLYIVFKKKKFELNK